MQTSIIELEPKEVTETVTPLRIEVRLKKSEAKAVMARLQGGDETCKKLAGFLTARLAQLENLE